MEETCYTVALGIDTALHDVCHELNVGGQLDLSNEK